MIDYKILYAFMVGASERAIEAIDRREYAAARDILIAAEQECEERYLQQSEKSP